MTLSERPSFVTSRAHALPDNSVTHHQDSSNKLRGLFADLNKDRQTDLFGVKANNYEKYMHGMLETTPSFTQNKSRH